jgi:hypothetical protein
MNWYSEEETMSEFRMHAHRCQYCRRMVVLWSDHADDCPVNVGFSSDDE